MRLANWSRRWWAEAVLHNPVNSLARRASIASFDFDLGNPVEGPIRSGIGVPSRCPSQVADLHGAGGVEQARQRALEANSAFACDCRNEAQDSSSDICVSQLRKVACQIALLGTQPPKVVCRGGGHSLVGLLG